METERLTLRGFRNGDFDDFAGLIKDKAQSEYAVYDEQFPTDDAGLKAVLGYFISSDEFYAIELKVPRKVIGFVSLNRVDGDARNLGYCVHSAYQRKGLASEAVKRIIEYAKGELSVTRLVSGTAEENMPSVRLLQRMGFTLTGKSQGSFANDESGKRIIFTGCSFERRL